MNIHNQFSIPYKGIGLGKNEYQFAIDEAFFASHNSPNITNGNFSVDMILDKKNDHCVILFDIKGKTGTQCDRCLSEMELSVSGNYSIIVKFEEDDFNEENDEVIFMSPDTSTLNVENMIYEYINLSLPFTKTCDDDPSRECDPEILDRLGIFEEEEETEGNNNNQSGIWDSLKDLNLDK